MALVNQGLDSLRDDTILAVHAALHGLLGIRLGCFPGMLFLVLPINAYRGTQDAQNTAPCISLHIYTCPPTLSGTLRQTDTQV
jgi:hypothetical protein